MVVLGLGGITVRGIDPERCAKGAGVVKVIELVETSGINGGLAIFRVFGI